MPEAAVNDRKDRALREVLDAMLVQLADALRAIIDRSVTAAPETSELHCVDIVGWRESWLNRRAALRGDLSGIASDDTPHPFVLVFDLSDVITFCGHLMLASDDVVRESRESMAFGSDQLETLGELGNVLCNSLQGGLRRGVHSKASLRVREVAVLDPGGLMPEILGRGPGIVYSARLQARDLPATSVHFLFDHEIGRRWNDQIAPFEQSLADDHAEHPGNPAKTISAFATSLETVTLVRECATHLHLDVQRFSRSDVPNPAAHSNEIVVIEIPVGEEKRFDWAKRLKASRRNITVVLLIHEPSRPRVVQGLLTRSNAILAWPSTEAQLLEKLEPLLGAQDES